MNDVLQDNLNNRQLLLKTLREELVGPAPRGKDLDCSKPVKFELYKESYGPWRDKNTGDEILQRDPPTKRYGIGVLYPWQTLSEDTAEDAGTAAIGMHSQGEKLEGAPDSALTKDGAKDLELSLSRETRFDEELSDLDLTATNTYRPSSMGLSFLAELPEQSKIKVEVSIGRYEPIEVLIQNTIQVWWRRIAVTFVCEFDAEDICRDGSTKLEYSSQSSDNAYPLNLNVELYSRPSPINPDPRQKLMTVCLVNRTEASKTRLDQICAFQSHFSVNVVGIEHGYHIQPYPESLIENSDSEEKSLALLYRNFQTYAVGHGCSADWGKKDLHGFVSRVSAECLPVFEAPSTTPDIADEDGNPIKVSMASLAGLVPDTDGFDELQRVIKLYEGWIEKKERDIPNLPEKLQETARQHLQHCSRCAERMWEGIQYLHENPVALRAFRLANEAILVQQLVRKIPRIANFDEKANRWVFSDEYSEPDFNNLGANQGQWRAFQIAFLLMSLKSTIENDDPDRETVELIWFPTGGGKTEAYLGLAAFALIMRRLINPEDIGVHVITRYTLRLLTAQQFQRASRLVCALEDIRRRNSELGETPFSIGIWVGGSNTPNTRRDAVATFQGLSRGDRYTENKFILGQCPWCGAQMGPIKKKAGRKWTTHIAGYHREGKTIVYRCPDNTCQFHAGLPVYTIDEDIYDIQPSIIIGTVDKFATLTWRPEARALFGIGTNGDREHSPPGLIIQDELHLISGPLGSMVGLYESVIEELCTIRTEDRVIRPKIVSSTATIRRYTEQVKALYAREHVVLFPPSGIEADDSFFAKYARDEKTGELLPGRAYVGIHGPGLGSLQTVQVRTFTALMQASTDISTPELQDPWWTLLIFFNSLRELGTTLSLFQSDIPDYLIVTANRLGIPYGQMRKLWRIRELTGRLRSDEVPEAIANLEVPQSTSPQQRPVDACLASNILEVGVDIDRLSLMAVVGQPKSTSQYIQVTGRVGRRWWERPGLVATIYTASKPRDRSHFEKFRTYHERLYAQVEPVSVTPFSPPALDRALHAIMALFVRQFGDEQIAQRPYPYPEDLIEDLRQILMPRVESIDPAEKDNFQAVFERRASEWARWNRTVWERHSADDSFLLLRAGEYAENDNRLFTWSTPTSMRNVDAECQAQITSLYLQQEAEE